jgi:hypothetical protein
MFENNFLGYTDDFHVSYKGSSYHTPISLNEHSDWSGTVGMADPGLDVSYRPTQDSALLIDNAGYLSTISSVDGNNINLGVNEAYHFFDGFGISGAAGDTIYDDDGNSTTITDIVDHNTITVSSSAGFAAGDGITVVDYEGTAPDIGRYEYGDGSQNSQPAVSIDSPSGPQTIAVGGSISFSCTASDPDGDISLYLWTFDNSGIPNNTSEDPGNITFGTEGNYTVMVTVTDNSGWKASDSVEIVVGALASPTMVILPAND